MRRNVLKCTLGASILTGVTLPLAGCSCTIHHKKPTPPEPEAGVHLWEDPDGSAVEQSFSIDDGSSVSEAYASFDNIFYEGDLELLGDDITNVIITPLDSSYTFNDTGSIFSSYSPIEGQNIMLTLQLNGTLTPALTEGSQVSCSIKLTSKSEPQQTYYQSEMNSVIFKRPQP